MSQIKPNDKISSLKDAIFKVIEVSKNGEVKATCVEVGRSRVHYFGELLLTNLANIDTPRCNYSTHFIS